MLASQAMEGNLGRTNILIIFYILATPLLLGLLTSRDPLLQAMPNLSLALLLLNEHFNPQSFWKPYIGNVSTTFNIILSDKSPSRCTTN